MTKPDIFKDYLAYRDELPESDELEQLLNEIQTLLCNPVTQHERLVYIETAREFPSNDPALNMSGLTNPLTQEKSVL